jgi:predicted RNA binding protein YcfA (HicA-like mRNA interferase family)
MNSLHGLKPERVIKAFMRAGWKIERQAGSHVHLSKEGNENILSIPVHKSRPIKQGLLRNQIAKAKLTVEEFLNFYK